MGDVAHAAIDALAKDGKMTATDATRAIKLYKLDQKKRSGGSLRTFDRFCS